MPSSPRSLRFAVSTALAMAPVGLGCTGKDDKHVNPGPVQEPDATPEDRAQPEPPSTALPDPELEPVHVNEGPQPEPKPEDVVIRTNPGPNEEMKPEPEPKPEPKRVNTGPEKTLPGDATPE